MKKSISMIIVAVLAVTLLGGGIYGVYAVTNGGTTDARLFDIVTLDGKAIDNTIISLRDNEIIEFRIKPKIAGSEIPRVNVRAVPNDNAGNAIVKIGENEPRKLLSCRDFTSMFKIEIVNDVVTVSTDWEIYSYLAGYFVTDSEIKLDNYSPGKLPYMDLKFIAGNVTIKCSVMENISVSGIELDKDNVIIGGKND